MFRFGLTGGDSPQPARYRGVGVCWLDRFEFASFVIASHPASTTVDSGRI
jgi:hypothetical protein